MRDLARSFLRYLSTALSFVATGALVLTAATFLFTVFVSPKMAHRDAAMAPAKQSSPCEFVSDPACDAVARERYLSNIIQQQVRKIPVVVGWRDELPWGKQTRIIAVVASANSVTAHAAIAAALPDGHVEQQAVGIGRKVRAELSGPHVEIVKPEQTVRDVTGLQNVTFEWLVKPTRPGRTTLTLRLFNTLSTPDGLVEVEHPALVHEMSVRIGVLDWLSWQMDQTKGLAWVIGGALPLLGLVFANRAKLRRWWRRRRVAKAGPATPPPPPAPPSSPGP